MEVLLVVVLGGRVAATLLGEDVDDDRPVCRQFDGVAERLLELGDVVTVDGSDVPHAERFEERRRLEELADGCLERLDGPLGRRADDRHLAQEPLELALAADVDGVEPDVRQHLRKALADTRRERLLELRFGRTFVARGGEVRDRRGIAPTVVVEHDDDAAMAVAEVVQRLVRHAPGHRAVADDGDDVPVRIAAGVSGDGHPVGVGEDRRRVAVLHVVVTALLA